MTVDEIFDSDIYENAAPFAHMENGDEITFFQLTPGEKHCHFYQKKNRP